MTSRGRGGILDLSSKLYSPSKEGTAARNRIREYRQERGLSQAALAEAMGVTRQTIISIESGRYTPSLPLALRLGRYFGRPVEELFYLEEGEPS